MSEDVGETSKYNQAALQIQRLHNMWLEANKKRSSGDLEGWQWQLDAIWGELTGDAQRLGGTKDFDKREENKYYSKYEKLDGMIRRGILLLRTVEPGGRGWLYLKNRLFDLLREKHDFLRTLEEMSGKGTKLEDNYDDLQMV